MGFNSVIGFQRFYLIARVIFWSHATLLPIFAFVITRFWMSYHLKLVRLGTYQFHIVAS